MDTAKTLTKTHFPAQVPLMPTNYSRKQTESKNIMSADYDWITEDLIIQAMNGFQAKKSPGPDGLKPVIFPHIPKNFIKYLEFIYKGCVWFSFTPTKWKDTKLIFIPKPGKTSYNNAKSYRPISLSNYLLKTLERLAGWKMKLAIKENPVHTRQDGFRSDRSTESAISDASNNIESYILDRKFCIGVSLDIQAAFDSIKPHKIKLALLKHGGDPQMVNWYYNYLIHRNIYAEISGVKLSFSTSTGFPQGGVNSADFWIIVFDPALQIINQGQARGDGFADDLLVMRGGYSLKASMKELQTIVEELVAWGKQYGLKFNSEKQ